MSDTGGRPARRLRASDVLVGAAAVLTIAGLVVRWQYRDGQSYWSDELFSVDQAGAHSLRHVVRVGLAEVHTPLFAVLTHLWIRLGGTQQTAWVRLLPVLLGSAAVLAGWSGLRGLGLSREARWLCVAATSADGFLITYSQEVRPYALATLGAVGVTAASLHRWRGGWRGGRWGGPWGWTAWALLAASSHLLGAVLVVVLAAMLGGRALGRPREALSVAVACTVALVPQATWIGLGLDRQGFASGTDWIHAPAPGDVLALVLSAFPAGGLTPRADGFAWTAPWGLLAVVGLALAAVVARRGPAGSADDAGSDVQGSDVRVSDVAAARFLLGAATGTVVVTYLVAQVVHLWTLRNLVVVVPALLWGVVCLVLGLPRGRNARQMLATLTVTGLAVSLATVTIDLSRPYKTDFRSAMEYLVAVRAHDPAATFVFLSSGAPRRALLAADRSPDDPAMRHLFDRVELYPRQDTSIRSLHRTSGAEVVLYYPNLAGAGNQVRTQAILSRLGAGCAPVPVYGLIMVACPGRNNAPSTVSAMR